MFNQKYLLNNIINKTNVFLDSVQKFIPLYENSKPIINKILNLKDRFMNLKSFNNVKKTDNIKEIKKEEKVVSTFSPQFFQ